MSGKDKVVVVPTTVEEKFIHDTDLHPPEEEQSHPAEPARVKKVR